MSSPIVAILNNFCVVTGKNAAQVVVRTDGSVQVLGDEALARRSLGMIVNSLVSKLGPAEERPRPAGDRLKVQGR